VPAADLRMYAVNYQHIQIICATMAPAARRAVSILFLTLFSSRSKTDRGIIGARQSAP
jgi:hypothetical protein